MRFTTNKPSTRTTNLAGGRAFSMSPEMELVHAVLTTFLDDKFYETGGDRIARIVELVKKNDPKFVSNLATVARQEFHLRSVVVVLIGELAKVHRGDSLVKETIVRSTQRVDDLIELVSYFKKDKLALPKQVKRGIRNALLKFSRYQLAKYRAKGKTTSLVDVFNLVRPKPQHANEEQKLAWKDLMEGKLVSFDTWETEISNAKDDAARRIAWQQLISNDKLGYMALIRNLNNLVKYDVSPETLNTVVSKLTDRDEVKRSKQLPFRFYTAFQNVKGSRKLSDAISVAMDHAVDNVPELPGRTLIAVDCSGSMAGESIEKAAIFAATLVRANENAELVMFDTSLKSLTVSGRTPVVDIARHIISEATGGGTETSLVFKYCMDKKKEFDRIIILSDNESWQESYNPGSSILRIAGRSAGAGVNAFYNEYKRVMNTDPYVYAIDIAGYGTKDVAGSKVFHLAGWSARLLDFVGAMERGETLVDYVREYIPMQGRFNPREETVDNQD